MGAIAGKKEDNGLARSDGLVIKLLVQGCDDGGNNGVGIALPPVGTACPVPVVGQDDQIAACQVTAKG